MAKIDLSELDRAKMDLDALQRRFFDLSCDSQDRAVKDKCGRVELMLRAAGMMCERDPGGDEVVKDPEIYIANKIQSAIRAYGLKVVS